MSMPVRAAGLPGISKISHAKPWRLISIYGPPTALGLACLTVWEVTVRVLNVPDYLMPAPSAIGSQLSADRTLLQEHTLVTLQEIVFGVLLAIFAGLVLGVALHLFPTLRRAVYPLLIGSQTIPIVVLAPILVILLGFGIAPKLAIVALICFFPVVVNAVDGLKSVDPEFVRMMLTLDASRWSIFRRVEFPSALPAIFSGIRIAVTYAAIGAVFGEWAGASQGLGYLMLQSTSTLETTRIFAAIVILTLIALGLFLLVALIERILIPWARESGGRSV